MDEPEKSKQLTEVLDGLEKPEKLIAVLEALRKDPDFLYWPERRILAVRCFEIISSGHPLPAADLALHLAHDPKWEVRKDVADNLLLLPEEYFLQAAAALNSDTNSFVINSLSRAMDKRRQGRKKEINRKKKLSIVQGDYLELERTHGKAVARKAMRMAEQYYNTLVGSVVHDMRNILSPIKSGIFSLSQSLYEGDFSAIHAVNKFKKLMDMTAFMEKLLDDMKTYSEPLSSKRQPERLSTIVKKAHEMAVETLKASLRFPGEVTFSISIPEKMILEVSQLQIITAFVNIIKNAYESYAKGPGIFKPGEIRISAVETGDGHVEITVADNGAGLSASELEKVLQFVPGGTSKGRHGTGYGLPIAKRMIEWHNGSISITSGESSGTTVLISLPIESEGENVK